MFSLAFIITMTAYFTGFAECSNEVLPEPPKMTDFVVISDVRVRLANVKVMTRVVNEAKEGREAMFQVQFPKEAFISGFKMTIGNEVRYGVVKEREEANEIYNKAKEEGKSAGQVSQQPSQPGRDMDVFVINVNVAAQSSTAFELSYIEFLEMKFGRFDHKLHIEPGQVVANLSARISVFDPQGITKFSYKLPDSNEEMTSSNDLKFAVYQASMDTHHVQYHPSESEQRLHDKKTGINGQISVRYEIERQNNGGLLIVNDNYFVHYFSPTGLDVMDKNIVFVIDISGSMSGGKIKAVRDVLMVILDQLRPQDKFNLLLFDDKIEMWNTEAVPAAVGNILEAKAFALDKLVARGSTDINRALLSGIDSLRTYSNEERRQSDIIVFLTDGQPTSGVTVTYDIRENVKRKNEGQANIYVLGFGSNVNMNFLKALAWENGGFARRIYEDFDASKQLELFYQEIESPLLINLKIEYEPVPSVFELTETAFSTYRSGSEIVVVGVCRNEQALSAKIEGTGKRDVVDYVIKPDPKHYPPEKDFVELLWAYKTIKQFLKEMTIVENITQHNILKEKAVNLSIKYQFVTPLTSMVVTSDMRSSNLPSHGSNEMFLEAHASFFDVQGILKKNGKINVQHLSTYDGNTASSRDITLTTTLFSALHIFYRLIRS